MKSFFFTVLCAISVCFYSIQANAQCSTLGQTPTSAFPACGSSVFNQNNVPVCANGMVPTPGCSAGSFQDKNPYYYKFTCFSSGLLSFLITPTNASNDYDWQLFDITGKNAADIFTDASMFVACNWCSNTLNGGITGTGPTGTTLVNCDGPGFPQISAQPLLIKDHEYLLMVSNFDNLPQGYSLSFGGGTAVITDSVSPAIKNIDVNCIADKIFIKLNKRMKCNSIAANSSDFTITTNPTISSAIGFGCSTGFDTDSVTLTLATPLAAGNYTVSIKNGTDGNTIIDNCGTGIPVGSGTNFTVIGAAKPTPMDSITPATICEPNSVQLVFGSPIKCNSVAANGSDFTVTGPSAVTVSSASIVCTSNVGTIITVNFTGPIKVRGTYQIKLNAGTDGNTLLNPCNIQTLAGSTLNFDVLQKPDTSFTITSNYGCTEDTLTFSHGGTNDVTQWKWTFNSSFTSNAQTATFMTTNFTTRTIKLVVANKFCSDSVSRIIPIPDHTVKAAMLIADTICSKNNVYTDASLGNIKKWFWSFDNGFTSVKFDPPAQNYPVLLTYATYHPYLIVTNAFGCSDSLNKTVTVYPGIPAVFDSVVPPTCGASTLHVYFKVPMLCSSLTATGSEFTISGPSGLTVIGASMNCVNGVGRVMDLQLSAPITVTSNYTLNMQSGTDGNTVINSCGFATPAASVGFKGYGAAPTTFTVTPKYGCFADTLTFSHNGANGVNKWDWTIDGIFTSQLQSFTEVFNYFTPHTIKLIVTNPLCTDTVNSIFTVPDHSIKAKIDCPDTTCPNTGMQFTDSSKGLVNHWVWDFGNGQTSSLQNPPLQYYAVSLSQAYYLVTLRVANTVGCVDTTSKTFLVKAAVPTQFDSIVPPPCSTDTILLRFSTPMLCSSIAPDGTDFSITGPSTVNILSATGFCTNGASRLIQLVLTSPITVSGNYTMNLKTGSDGNTLLNDCGLATAATSLPVHFYIKVNPAFTYFDKKACLKDTLKLFHNGNSDASSWLWTVNGQLIDSVQNPVVPYNVHAIDTVFLLVGNPRCKDTSSQIIPVSFDSLQALFIINTNQLCPLETVQVHDTSRGVVAAWNWNFGNGVISTAQNPAPQSYPALNTTINYPIRLIVSNNVPCYDTAYKFVQVVPNCYIDVPTAFTPNGDGRNDYLYPLNGYKAVQLLFRVFNRYGEIIFETKEWTKKWDGTYKGIKQPSGTYVWVLDYTNKDTGKKVSMHGTSVLIR